MLLLLQEAVLVEEVTERVQTTFAGLTEAQLWLGLTASAIRIAITILIAIGVILFVRRATRRWERSVEHLAPFTPRRQRTITASSLIRSTARWSIIFLAGFSILSEVGVEIGPLLAGAGILGLAVGFGAQTLVKDVISGIFLLFDDTIHVGDLVRAGDDRGVVEHLGLRIVQLRTFTGEVVIIPTGELRTFGNWSVGFARAIVPIGLAYEQNLDDVLPVLEEIAREWAAIEANRAIMLQDEPEVQSVMALGDSSVTARIVMQVVPGEQFRAERELRRLIKQRFDEKGIEIPFPRRTIYVRNEDAAEGGEPK
ncbi:mechanosensitive ion channel family protein [soil metagenome]